MKLNSFAALLAILLFQLPGISAEAQKGVPTLDEVAGDWLVMDNVANPPAVHNFNDMLLVNYDLTSFFCYPEDWLWSNGPRAGYPLVSMTVDGREYSTTECRWYPYRVLRRNLDCGGFAVETDTRMINEQRAVLVRICITNSTMTAGKAEFTLSAAGSLTQDEISVLNKSQRPGFVSVVRPVQKPDATTNDNGVVRWQWRVALPAGGKQVIEFVSGDGRASEMDKVCANVGQWSGHFSAEFDGFKQCWEQRWSDTFMPGNKHFSGNLPVLDTENAQLKRNYYMGIATVLALERTRFPVHPRSFITSGERAPGIQYYWDASMQGTIWALLEPAGMKATLRRWLVQNMRSGCYIELKDEGL